MQRPRPGGGPSDTFTGLLGFWALVGIAAGLGWLIQHTVALVVAAVGAGALLTVSIVRWASRNKSVRNELHVVGPGWATTGDFDAIARQAAGAIRSGEGVRLVRVEYPERARPVSGIVRAIASGSDGATFAMQIHVADGQPTRWVWVPEAFTMATMTAPYFR